MKNALIVLFLISCGLAGCANLPEQDTSLSYLPRYVHNYSLASGKESATLLKSDQASASFASFMSNESGQSLESDSAFTYISESQFQLLQTSNSIAEQVFNKESDVYKDLKTAPGVIMYKVTNVHFILGGISMGDGVLFDNVHHRIYFLTVQRYNYGLGIGGQNLYVVVKINSLDKLKAMIEQDNFHLDSRFMFMLGTWGKQVSLSPGINIVYMTNGGFDLGFQAGAAVYNYQKSNESQVQESAVSPIHKASESQVQ